MKQEKKKLDELTKAKLLLQGEYLLISIIFLVLGILKLAGVYNTSTVRGHIFNFVTLVGGIWTVTDFCWSTFSKKRREKVTYLDKVLALPLGLYLIAYNLISIIIWNNVSQWYQYGIGFVFIYAFLMFSFEAIYHWFYPTKALLDAVKEDEQEKSNELLKSAEKDDQCNIETNQDNNVNNL